MAHVHKFDIESFEDGVSIGRCACGAIQYYPAYYSSPEKHHADVKLPTWNDDWLPIVQVQWLKTYEKLQGK